MRTIRFGVIGCGLMGREFASAAARWCHLSDMPAKPEILAACDRAEGPRHWFESQVPTVRRSTADYRDLLAEHATRNLIFGSMISFLGILFAGYVYAVKKKAFDWKS